MNIIKLQNMLRGVPDDALIGYVQNPQGEVPSYLALSELQRRKDTRAKYEAQQAPESSVLEDLTQGQALSSGQVDMLMKGIYKKRLEEAQPQGGLAMLAKNPDLSPGAPMSQGVADLPVPDEMYQQQNFAGGGIVAFADGGFMKKARDYLLPPSPKTMRELQGKTRLSPFMGGMGDMDAYQYADPNYLLKKREMLYRQLEMPGADKNAIYAEINALDQQTARPPSVGGYVPPEKLSNEPDVKLDAEPLPKQTGQPGGAVDSNFYNKMLKKEKTLQELSDEFKATLGTDPTLAGRQEKLAKMEARAKRMEDMAPGMAMLEAGLGIAAGTSPFALANIGKGAMAGVKSYGDAQNKLADLEEKRFALDTELAKQQRAEQMAAITFGDRSRQHTEEINKTVMLAQARDKLERDTTLVQAGATRDAAIIRANAANSPKIEKIAEARAAYQGSEAQNKVKKALLKQLGDNAEKDTSPRHKEYLDGLKLAEEQYLANYFAQIGSNIPTASTEGFKIKK